MTTEYELDNIEQEFRDCIVLDKQHREELTRYVISANCKNYLRLFDFVQRWRSTPDGDDRVDLVVYICKIFVESTSWKSVTVSDDLREKVEVVVDRIDEDSTCVREEVEYIMLCLEKQAIQSLMEVFVNHQPKQENVSPRRKTIERTESFKERMYKFSRKISFLRKLKLTKK
jgi:hypothetical protein